MLWLDKISAAAARLTSWVVVAMAATMIGALILQVFCRYVLGSALSWAEELAIMLFAWVVLLAATTAIRDGAHVRLDFLVAMLPEAAQRIWLRVIAIAVFGFCALFATAGASYVEATMGQVTAAMRVPIEWLHLAAPIAGGLGAFHAFVRIFLPVAPASQELPS